MISIESLEKEFPFGGELFAGRGRGRKVVRAVNGVTLTMKEGEIHGLVGESGSGKTTLGRLIAKLVEPTSGRVLVDGVDFSKVSNRDLRESRGDIQYIFQDPFSALDDRQSVRSILLDPLNIMRRPVQEEDLVRTLQMCGLVPASEILNKFPRQLSGGQRQRLCLARVVLIRPKVMIADEVVSMLDVSTRVGILDLIRNLHDAQHFTCVFITHDLVAAEYLCDRLSVMYSGRIVETGKTKEIFLRPKHPYTRALIASAPRLKRDANTVVLTGEPPDASNMPSGCSFSPRCPYAEDHCRSEAPDLEEFEPDHFVSCFRAREISDLNSEKGIRPE